MALTRDPAVSRPALVLGFLALFCFASGVAAQVAGFVVAGVAALADLDGLVGLAFLPLVQSPLEFCMPASACQVRDRVLEAQANTLGFHDGFLLIGVVFIGALVPAYILSKSR